MPCPHNFFVRPLLHHGCRPVKNRSPSRPATTPKLARTLALALMSICLGGCGARIEANLNVLVLFLQSCDVWRVMQLALSIDRRHEALPEVDDRLRRRFGRPGPWWRLDPVSQLMAGMIGGKTPGAVSQRAFEALIRRFKTWEGVRDAPVDDVYYPIRDVTFGDVKAGRLKSALQNITAARGRLELDFLRALTVDEALTWLERLQGVGRKTSAVTLNFSTLQKKALVIDTHHLRVLRRLGLIGPRAGTTEAYERVMACLPSAWTADDLTGHHHLMKSLGQKLCGHAVTDCPNCPLNDMCPAALFRPSSGGLESPARRRRETPVTRQHRSADVSRFGSVVRRARRGAR